MATSARFAGITCYAVSRPRHRTRGTTSTASPRRPLDHLGPFPRRQGLPRIRGGHAERVHRHPRHQDRLSGDRRRDDRRHGADGSWGREHGRVRYGDASADDQRLRWDRSPPPRSSPSSPG